MAKIEIPDDVYQQMERQLKKDLPAHITINTFAQLLLALGGTAFNANLEDKASALTLLDEIRAVCQATKRASSETKNKSEGVTIIAIPDKIFAGLCKTASAYELLHSPAQIAASLIVLGGQALYTDWTNSEDREAFLRRLDEVQSFLGPATKPASEAESSQDAATDKSPDDESPIDPQQFAA